jgi:hypothetical protein
VGTVAPGRRPRELGKEGRTALRQEAGSAGEEERRSKASEERAREWWRSSRLVGGEVEGGRDYA